MAESKVRGMLDDRLFLIKHYNYQYTLNAGATKTLKASDFGFECPDGYYPIALVNFNAGDVNIYTSRVLANKSASQVMMVKNTGSDNKTATAQVQVLYLKDSYVTDITS